MIDQSDIIGGGSTLVSTFKALRDPEFGFTDAEIEASIAELPDEVGKIASTRTEKRTSEDS